MKPKQLLTLGAALALSGCGDYAVVDKSEDVVISKAEYAQLKAAALQPKEVGRYQLHREGPRTWRLDTTTGNSCLLLASEWDWKNDAKEQNNCATEDYTAAQKRHRLYPKVYDQNGDPVAESKPAQAK